jgi:hypothetical protein
MMRVGAIALVILLAAASPAAAADVAAPVWRVGDAWTVAFTPSWEDGGTVRLSVEGVEKIDGVEHYVVRSGDATIYQRTSDLATTIETSGGRLIGRYTPAFAFAAWPLTIGKSWESRYVDEREGKKRSVARACRAEAEERVSVPAGVFKAVRIVCRTIGTGEEASRIWYAPAAKQVVRGIVQVGGGLLLYEVVKVSLK